ncbi:MAG: S8 family peptidase [Opitutaceae bacterium]
MKFIRPLFILCALALLGGGIGYRLSQIFQANDGAKQLASDQDLSTGSSDEQLFLKEASEGEMELNADTELPSINYPKNAIRGELVMQFTDRAEYEAYLNALAAKGLNPLGQIDRLMVVRVDNKSLLAVDPDQFELTPDYSYEVLNPLPPIELSPEALASLRGFGLTAQQIAGGMIDGDGAGVMVAILDSGIQEHSQFEDSVITHLDLTDAGIGSEGAGHGTSVASIIGGSEGLAPNSELLVVRVLDDQGIGNSFQVAEGIVRATDLGARIINLSLAVYQDSAVLRQAVSYANSQGVLLVAAAGNDGYDEMPFPAAYDSVISVTAIDANSRQALFPNQSTAIDIAAPGVSILTANEEQGTILFTGTSAAAPFISGTLAAMLSADPNLSNQQVLDTIKSNLNEAGSPGEDSLYGDGIIDWDRLRERDTPGILDIAVADIHLDPTALPGTTMPIEVTLQNRGTQWFPESDLEVVIGDADPVEFTIGSLGPGLTTTRKVFAQVPFDGSEERLEIVANVLPEDRNTDVRLENNIKGAFYQAK